MIKSNNNLNDYIVNTYTIIKCKLKNILQYHKLKL